MSTYKFFKVLACVTPDVVNLMYVLILLCLIAIFWSMVGFCLDVIGPNKKTLRFIRRNALPPIWTGIDNPFAVICSHNLLYPVWNELISFFSYNISIYCRCMLPSFQVTWVGCKRNQSSNTCAYHVPIRLLCCNCCG